MVTTATTTINELFKTWWQSISHHSREKYKNDKGQSKKTPPKGSAKKIKNTQYRINNTVLIQMSLTTFGLMSFKSRFLFIKYVLEKGIDEPLVIQPAELKPLLIDWCMCWADIRRVFGNAGVRRCEKIHHKGQDESAEKQSRGKNGEFVP